MGRQVNFYLAPSDLKPFEVALRKKLPMLVLRSRVSSPKPVPVESFEIEDMGKDDLKLFLVHPNQASQIRFQHLPTQGYWTIDIELSPVVEFWRCYFDGQVLRRGRLYYITGYYRKGDAWTEKPRPFLEWADGVLKSARKALRRDPQVADYVGQEAWDLHKIRHVKLTFM